ncbi:hypothetical protein O6H91_10G072600 [Diphasiastrum complanatum]|uniref:Uncharacterized protein n=1 Tax=Diphasiastrum complanatum TaxID=34168 RepID=A0ACC2CID4_DIPCM|nr:hypothetical protein O6H91_10G072600 [Diphasiastrum complanatum]
MESAARGRPRVLLLLLGFVVAIVQRCEGLAVTVYNTECVYEHVDYDDDMVTGNFVVMDHEIFWGADHPGIDFTVTAPAGTVVLSVSKSSGEHFKFRAPRKGLYKFCFHNPSSTPETVTFYIHVGHIPTLDHLAKEEHFDPVHAKIAELKEGLETVRTEQIYMRARAVRHHLTNKSTQKRLMYYTLALYLALVGASLLQGRFVIDVEYYCKC